MSDPITDEQLEEIGGFNRRRFKGELPPLDNLRVLISALITERRRLARELEAQSAELRARIADLERDNARMDFENCGCTHSQV